MPQIDADFGWRLCLWPASADINAPQLTCNVIAMHVATVRHQLNLPLGGSQST